MRLEERKIKRQENKNKYKDIYIYICMDLTIQLPPIERNIDEISTENLARNNASTTSMKVV